VKDPSVLAEKVPMLVVLGMVPISTIEVGCKVPLPAMSFAITLMLIGVLLGVEAVSFTAVGASKLTVMDLVAEVVPHELVTAYVIVAEPAVTPVTTPAELTVATPVFEELQTPPLVVSLSAVVLFTETVDAPIMSVTVVVVLMVKPFVTVVVPHELVTA
jgi:hypothetical protein